MLLLLLLGLEPLELLINRLLPLLDLSFPLGLLQVIKLLLDDVAAKSRLLLAAELLHDFLSLRQLRLAFGLPVEAELPAVQVSGLLDQIDFADLLAPLGPHADELVEPAGDVAEGCDIDAPDGVDLALVGIVDDLGPDALRGQKQGRHLLLLGDFVQADG